jgi:hypothetical protein
MYLPVLIAIPVLYLGYRYMQSTSAPVPTDIDGLLNRAIMTGVNSGSVVATREQRLEAARIIVREFLAAGYPIQLALAAVVNANVESRLARGAIGDSGKSVGLFQLHESGGGYGMTVEQRKDPVANTRRIIEQTQAAWTKTSGKDLATNTTLTAESLKSAVERKASVATLAGLFGFHVERPYDLKKALARSEESKRMFGGI